MTSRQPPLRISGSQGRVLRALRERWRGTTRELSEATGLPRRAVARALAVLLKSETVGVVHGSRPRTYVWRQGEFEAPLPATYPPALKKACGDSFEYAIVLRDGTRIVFTEARAIDETWVHIAGVTSSPYAHILDRGLDLRVDSILWAADAPNGS